MRSRFGGQIGNVRSMYDVLKVVHVLTAVFMAAPLYNLIVVNERRRFGKAPLEVDQYFENIIRGNSLRCYVLQLAALVTGVALVVVATSPLSLVTNRVVLIKLLLLFTLVSLLSVVHFSIQPRIDRLLAQETGTTISPPLAAQIVPLRLRRTRLASLCLFLVIAEVLLGLQVYSRFGSVVTLMLLALAAVFVQRVYRTGVTYGWF